MSEYKKNANKLIIKVVYYGPALSGKTTNLAQLYAQLRPQRKGELMVLESGDDRTLFFDMLPIGLRSNDGLDLRVKIYTVPGQIKHDSTRKALLSRVDGVVFVADSQIDQQDNNAVAFSDLADNLTKVGLDIERLPLTVQFNKRDHQDAMEKATLHEKWAETPWTPLTFASALRGEGVVESFRQLLARLYPVVNEEFNLSTRHALDSQEFVRQLSAVEEARHE
ncbi:hypothetical protein L861_00165 [Litchfieldella anticariensis FP35 = DSM 16096]|uniref:GTPase n=1 Tax=Litchfieldella anticariensis (strain DSM 16096 / CECT 5854 / CIP 108499 / LMG 22089 / FP35) TaxID=1121939 RepID=S2KT95_LITA3|nr:GTPase domain-containing protein [Halomonas anticariensis]EPC03743.1 hypothetical protein L861_00165 [Halomonas anticariensis FP35 = DSM 16096]